MEKEDVFSIEHVDIPAGYVGLPEGKSTKQPDKHFWCMKGASSWVFGHEPYRFFVRKIAKQKKNDYTFGGWRLDLAEKDIKFQ